MLRNALVPLVALGVLACSPPAADQAAKSDAQTSEPAAPAAPVSANGTVTAVNAEAGTISINHEPIAAIGWPAMEMQFQAEDPSILRGVAVGDRVAFELKSAQETQTIVSVQRQ